MIESHEFKPKPNSESQLPKGKKTEQSKCNNNKLAIPFILVTPMM